MNVKKYTPDALIPIGIWILAYTVLVPQSLMEQIQAKINDRLLGTNLLYLKMSGVILITIGIEILARKFINSKRK